MQRKTLLLAGQVICAVSAASFSFVIFLKTPTSFLCVCLALRVVNGIGSAAVDTSSFAIISRYALSPMLLMAVHDASDFCSMPTSSSCW